ncbi:SURF1 family protein [Kineosporia sp. A_224]|uniref:SURF1 family protein n=1 Tax=Kineosporia sp. A_224 TaxID=1962180 RepID=UPI000B4B9295|nr:SURF1 family protein [Kineosporia sp. A_224]
MLRTALKPRWLALLVVVLVAAAGMARLGQWQWDRAHDNADENVVARTTQPPVPIGTVIKARQTFTGLAADRPVVAVGTYSAADQLLVPERRLSGRTGLWVLTPLVLEDGSAVGVVRGWVPDAADPAGAAAAVPTGPVAVQGVLRPAEPPADRAPGETSGLPAGQVERVDVTELIGLWRWPLLTGYLVLTDYVAASAADGTTTAVPVETAAPARVPAVPEGTGGIDLRNLSYAGQWFLFAGFGIFMWWRLVRDDHLGVLPPSGPDGDPADPDPAAPEPSDRTTPHEGATL